MRPPRAARTTVAALALLTVACGGPDPAPRPAQPEPSPSASAGADPARQPTRFYVDPAGHAPARVRALRAAGKVAEAERISAIARQPTAVWFSGQHADPYVAAQRLTGAAAAARRIPVLVLYNVPQRDCGQYSSGGARDVDAYLKWVGDVAAGVGDRPAVVVLEPDAVAQAVDGCLRRAAAAERYRALAEAVKILKRRPAVKVYLDAGNAGWIEDLGELAAALDAGGIGRADGFSVNVANFYATADSVGYGLALSDRLRGAHFLVDTGRNGSGPPPERNGRGHAEHWCNPPGRTLGTPPTTRTADPRVDAYLWIKQPGDSDGACRPGAPPAGTWWQSAALDLTR